jgi:8-amino-7-oxononanoate synthase
MNYSLREKLSRYGLSRDEATPHYGRIGKLTNLQLQQKLGQLIAYFRTELDNLNHKDSSTLEVEHFTNSPIFSLRSSVPRVLASVCQERGYTVRAIMPPTVPAGKERVRVCLHAGNTVEEIDGLLETIATWLQRMEKQKARL